MITFYFGLFSILWFIRNFVISLINITELLKSITLQFFVKFKEIRNFQFQDKDLK